MLFTIKARTLWNALLLTFNTIMTLGSEFHLANQCIIVVVLMCFIRGWPARVQVQGLVTLRMFLICLIMSIRC
jgi:hypothetical protein